MSSLQDFIRDECPDFSGGRCVYIEDLIPSCELAKSKNNKSRYQLLQGKKPCCLTCENRNCDFNRKCKENLEYLITVADWQNKEDLFKTFEEVEEGGEKQEIRRYKRT